MHEKLIRSWRVATTGLTPRDCGARCGLASITLLARTDFSPWRSSCKVPLNTERQRQRSMRFGRPAALLAFAALTAGLAGANDSPDQRRAKIRKKADATLTDLY